MRRCRPGTQPPSRLPFGETCAAEPPAKRRGGALSAFGRQPSDLQNARFGIVEDKQVTPFGQRQHVADLRRHLPELTRLERRIAAVDPKVLEEPADVEPQIPTMDAGPIGAGKFKDAFY